MFVSSSSCFYICSIFYLSVNNNIQFKVAFKIRKCQSENNSSCGLQEQELFRGVKPEQVECGDGSDENHYETCYTAAEQRPTDLEAESGIFIAPLHPLKVLFSSYNQKCMLKSCKVSSKHYVHCCLIKQLKIEIRMNSFYGKIQFFNHKNI